MSLPEGCVDSRIKGHQSLNLKSCLELGICTPDQKQRQLPHPESHHSPVPLLHLPRRRVQHPAPPHQPGNRLQLAPTLHPKPLFFSSPPPLHPIPSPIPTTLTSPSIPYDPSTLTPTSPRP